MNYVQRRIFVYEIASNQFFYGYTTLKPEEVEMIIYLPMKVGLIDLKRYEEQLEHSSS